MLMVNEVYRSIQGESTWAGLPCVFIRLTGCHLRCRYCDSEYSFYEGKRRRLDEIMTQVKQYSCNLVQITGGEPLLQPNVHDLMSGLCDEGMTVLIETSGACDISTCDPRVIRIMDLKTPGSGEAARNVWTNLSHLNAHDEVKFVLCDQADYEWARDIIHEHRLHERVHEILLGAATSLPTVVTIEGESSRIDSTGCSTQSNATNSPSDPRTTARSDNEIPGVVGLKLDRLAQWILEDNLPVRLQLQLHKIIWNPAKRGV